MKNLIDRYLDGELTEEEATTLLEVIARDPEMETELRSYEEMLSLAAGDLPGDPSAGFTNAVMDRIAAGRQVQRAEPSRQPVPYWRSWRLGLAWAAALLVMFAIGRMTAGNGFEPGAGSGTGPTVTSTPRAVSGSDIQIASVSSLAERPRMIRFVGIQRASRWSDPVTCGPRSCILPRVPTSTCSLRTAIIG
jgi:anti-sigma factor RsiW